MGVSYFAPYIPSPEGRGFTARADKDDLQTAVNLIVIGEALIKIGKAMKKKLSGKKKRKKKRPRKRRK